MPILVFEADGQILLISEQHPSNEVHTKDTLLTKCNRLARFIRTEDGLPLSTYKINP